MSIMILAHPRSKSTLLTDCFSNYIGEIFNLNSVDQNTFQLKNSWDINSPSFGLMWRQSWTGDYLKYLENKLTQNPNVVFKVFFEHVAFSEEAQLLIRKINPRVISIHRQNELHAIKSHLIAKKRGFTAFTQKDIEPFYATSADFISSHLVCAVLSPMARSIYNISWSTTYEDFDPATFTEKDKMPQIQPQNSEESFSLIINESEIDRWYNAIKKPKLD